MNARISTPPAAVPGKACKRCGAHKPLVEFTNEKRNVDGRSGTCKQCAKERQALWNAAHADAVRAYKREYAASRYRADPDRIREELRLYRERNRAVVIAQYERRNARLRELRATAPGPLREKDADRRRRTAKKMRARDAARAAVAKGKLMKGPCEVCGALEVQAHHDDYDRPLDIRWLCPKHHGAHHRSAR